MATLENIRTVAKYYKKNIKEERSRIKSIDVNNKIIKTYGRRDIDYKITNSALNQLLTKLNIRRPISVLMDKFEQNSQTALPMSKIRTVNMIIKDIIDLGIRHQSQRSKIIYDNTNNTIKGVVGLGYNRISNLDVLDSAIKVYGKKITEKLSYIGDHGMQLFFESDKEAITPIVRERIQYGRSVGNSEFGGKSLSNMNGFTFLRCLNGVKLGEIKLGVRLIHTRKDLEEVFQSSLKDDSSETKILDLIDTWAGRPARFTKDDLENADALKRLNKMLGHYGITKKEYRKGIIEILKSDQVEENNINGYWIGNAVNNYASHKIENAYEANALLTPAYELMTMY